MRASIDTVAELEAVLKEVEQLMAAMIDPNNRKATAGAGLAIATLTLGIAEQNVAAARWYVKRERHV